VQRGRSSTEEKRDQVRERSTIVVAIDTALGDERAGAREREGEGGRGMRGGGSEQQQQHEPPTSPARTPFRLRVRLLLPAATRQYPTACTWVQPRCRCCCSELPSVLEELLRPIVAGASLASYWQENSPVWPSSGVLQLLSFVSLSLRVVVRKHSTHVTPRQLVFRQAQQQPALASGEGG